MSAPSFLDWKVAVAASSAGNLAGFAMPTPPAGGPGDTITDGAGTGPLVVDGHTVLQHDRILVRGQSANWQNGIYVAESVNTVFGQVATFGTIIQPTGTLVNGTYNVALTGGGGTLAVGVVTVAGGVITSVVVPAVPYVDSGTVGQPVTGSGYAVGNTLGFTATVGLGTGGSINVATLGPAWVLKRAPDANTSEQFPGMSCFVANGSTTPAGSAWVQNNAPVTLDVTSAITGAFITTLPSATPFFPLVPGTYTNVPLFGGNGSGAGATVVVSGSSVINLASAATYAVLAYSTITNVGSTVINGNVGLYPDTLTSITGFPPGVINGTVNAANAAAHQAILDATAAYTAGNLLTPSTAIPAELGGQVLAPGVYNFSGAGGSATLTTNITLTGPGTWVFQIAGSLTVTTGNVILAGGATAANVFWLVGTSATFAGATNFFGTIIAGTGSVTMATGGVLVGHMFSLTAAVTFGGVGQTVTASSPYTVTITSTGTGYLNGDVLTFGNYMGSGVYAGGNYGLGAGGTVTLTTGIPASSAVTFVELVA